MLPNTQKLYMTAYSIGLIVLVLQAFITVFQLATTISDTQKIAKLQHQYAQLTATQAQAEQAATKLAAISTVASQLPSGFETVSKPLVIATSDSVALR